MRKNNMILAVLGLITLSCSQAPNTTEFKDSEPQWPPAKQTTRNEAPRPSSQEEKEKENDLARYKIGNVNFDFDSAELNEFERDQISEMVARIKKKEQVQKIVLVGHTDSIGSSSYNNILAAKRAETVRHKLAERGVDPKLIETKTYGEANPVVDPQEPRERVINRRVTIWLFSKADRQAPKLTTTF